MEASARNSNDVKKLCPSYRSAFVETNVTADFASSELTSSFELGGGAHHVSGSILLSRILMSFLSNT